MIRVRPNAYGAFTAVSKSRHGAGGGVAVTVATDVITAPKVADVKRAVLIHYRGGVAVRPL